jgi:hypothetical protein
MPIAKEFTVLIEDRPGTRRCCKASNRPSPHGA